jgi:NADH-quinone oxidoreductase subunit L
MNEQLIPLIPALPIFGFAFTALFGRRIGRFAFLLPLLLVIASWAIAMGVVYTQLTGGYGEAGASVHLWTWIPAGDFQVEVGFRVDSLTSCLLIVVTTIGMLVHLYSVGYMAHDEARWRFFAYLNFFMFSMLLLVLADNFLVATASSGSGTSARRPRSPRRKPSSSTASATSGSRSGSWRSGWRSGP